MKKYLIKKVFAVFFGCWIMFNFTLPASAQWSVHINSDTSPTTISKIKLMAKQLAMQTTISATAKASKIQQAAEYVKVAQRWIKTVNHYTKSIIGDIKRFTSLKGILKTAEQQIGLSDDTLKALRDVGELIRSSFTLKKQFTSMVRSHLKMIESLHYRAKTGIFNPRADAEDLEEYLRHTLGKEAAKRVSNEDLAKTDPYLERLNYELSKTRALRTAKEKELTTVIEQLQKEGALASRARQVVVDDNGVAQSSQSSTTIRNSLSAQAVQTLTIQKGQLEGQIQDLVNKESELLTEIEKRYKALQGKYDHAYFKGRYWKMVLDSWNDLETVKTDSMEKLIDTYGTNNE